MIAIPPGQAIQIAAAQYRAGQFAAAEATCRRILAVSPEHPEALYWLALVMFGAGRFEESAECSAAAITHAPGDARHHQNLGAALCQLGRHDESIQSFQRALALREDSSAAHFNLCSAFLGAGRPDEAIASCRRALDFDPNFAEAHHSLGLAWLEKQEWGVAAACFRRALELRPRYAEALNNLGAACRCMGDVERAIDYYRRAIACQPGFAAAHWNLAFVLLLTSRFEEGWREYEWRLKSHDVAISPRDLVAPQWDGGPAPGRTIFIHAEQGFGDTIQFMRYVPLVRSRAQAAHVIVECPPELVRLLAGAGEWDAEIAARGSTDAADCLHVPLLSLPLVLGRFEPLQIGTPYLRADAGVRSSDGLRVGLAWAGRATHRRDRLRSIPAEKLAPLLRLPCVNFVSVQPGHVLEGVGSSPAHVADFADTAALLATLDLVITVDTAVAHLAGALGKPVWLLLAFAPDWRWGIDREDTPWYPSMRLLRQRAPGDWDAVIQRAADELRTLAR